MSNKKNLLSKKPRNFEKDAYGFLLGFIKRATAPFSAEHVTLAAQQKGIAPVDLRSWGSLFSQAAREGYIRRSNQVFTRTMGNGTKAPGWEKA